MLVRSANQAIGTPKPSAISVVITANPPVFVSAV